MHTFFVHASRLLVATGPNIDVQLETEQTLFGGAVNDSFRSRYRYILIETTQSAGIIDD
jgi:hypothetical protein